MQDEAVAVLQRLIRFDTVNPPGNERPALEFLRDLMTDAGFSCELVGAEHDRANLIARLKGDEPGPTLCYLSHVDTVYADPDDWERDPWSGDVADGELWGRGALDMKSQTAAEVVAAITLAKGGWRPKGELLIVCVSDEETGGEFGAQYVTQQHADKVRCDFLLNEGGGAVMPYDGRRLYGVCCGEKGTFRFTVTANGVAGHASIPTMGDNALLKLAPALERLGANSPGYDLTDVPAKWLAAVNGAPVNGDLDDVVEKIRQTDPRLHELLVPTLGVTMVPTRIKASEKINVIPARAELRVDCRVPPGLGEDVAQKRIDEVLGEGNWEVAFTERVQGNSSSAETQLMDAIKGWIGEHDPGAEVVPVILPGFTDSRWFRTAFPDCVAYGFFPMRHQDLYSTSPLIHSANERIDVRDLGWAAQCYADIARRLLG